MCMLHYLHLSCLLWYISVSLENLEKSNMTSVSDFYIVVGGCSSQPCENGGSCYGTPSGGFNCVCSSEFVGDSCQYG